MCPHTMIEEYTRRVAMLDFEPTSREELVGIVVIQDSLGCSDHETVVRSSWQ